MRRAMEEHVLGPHTGTTTVRSKAYDMKHLIDQLLTIRHDREECVDLRNLILSGMDYGVSRLIVACDLRNADAYRCRVSDPLDQKKIRGDIEGAHIRNPQLCGD